MKRDGTWDIRVPTAVRAWRELHRREPYYWKIDRILAQALVNDLSAVYSISSCEVSQTEAPRHNGDFRTPREGVSVIRVHRRAHVKTVVHEFYHLLDHRTRGEYQSDDKEGGPSSLAWQFADRWWAELTA